MSEFPRVRMRRLRVTEAHRRLVRETHLSTADLIYPLFVVEGTGIQREIAAMPGNYHWSVDRLPYLMDEIASLGIPGVLLFGVPDAKDEVGSSAYAEDGIVQRAIRAIKRSHPDLLVITDVCLCEYTSHGHCGVVGSDGQVQNDATLALLQRTAVSHAQAGAEIIAPSDMMDGRIGAIRAALDEHGFEQVAILAYAAKYASGFYGPFREAAGSAPQFGDRRAYQMDPANRREALREIALDVAEGADMVMVKPALAYLDIIRETRDRFDLPLAAYNVSGEYSMVKAAAANGWIDGDRIAMEILLGIKRAGADLILTYHALEAARRLKEGWGL
ncbi:MAG TPA: porphobilinogen synthase [Armatimonadota bacterium]|nr:porphobilinogen synthase [Armatimonadota bacterium]HOJ22723.1 porphobilinogen synthase [Armatimonadota bacterium]HPO74362.1 porphobilinogen synthase [Armatimonadota bacterium]HPT97099.1 porphobilinogen synthase [Armatimonadota bacterium]